MNLRITVATVPDRRYRLLVNLARTDRPRYWTIKCFNCGSKIGDLQNREVIGVDDFYDPQNIDNGGFMRHCKGVDELGLPCPYSYLFKLN